MTGTTLDRTYSEPADRSRLERVAEALAVRGMKASIVADTAAARAAFDALVPDGAVVYNSTSRTVDEAGISDDIRASERYRATRSVTETLDPATQMEEFRRHVSNMDVVVGSVQAVTDAGQVVIASGSGSQLAPYAYGATNVVWVVGAQKIVRDLDEAFDRIEQHCLPAEDARLREIYGMGSSVNKHLIVHGEEPGRITVLLVEEPLGV